jgi:hypothetical protein
VRLRDQALILPIAALCLANGGCARLLGAIFAPQDTVVSTATQAANQVTAPAQSEVAGLGQEVDRLLAANADNRAELARIRDELGKRGMQQAKREGAVQDEDSRFTPWHPRRSSEATGPGGAPRQDHLVLTRRGPRAAASPRGMPPPGPLPDGIAGGELLLPMQLSGRLMSGMP